VQRCRRGWRRYRLRTGACARLARLVRRRATWTQLRRPSRLTSWRASASSPSWRRPLRSSALYQHEEILIFFLDDKRRIKCPTSLPRHICVVPRPGCECYCQHTAICYNSMQHTSACPACVCCCAAEMQTYLHAICTHGTKCTWDVPPATNWRVTRNVNYAQE